MTEQRPSSNEIATDSQLAFYRSSPFEHTSTVPSQQQVTVVEGVMIMSIPAEPVGHVISVEPHGPGAYGFQGEPLAPEEMEWTALYAELAEEDRELAATGLGHYAEVLSEEEDAPAAR